jgi:hypothetical protein
MEYDIICAMKERNSQMDIRKHRFVAPISTTSKVFVDKKRKQKSRRFLNDKKNWEN